MTTTAVKERPILFAGRLVRAILSGAKTQTRRPMKPQPPEDWVPLGVEYYESTKVDRYGEEYPGPEIFGAYDETWGVACPFGGPEQNLWVRETWAETEDQWGCPIIAWRAGGSRVIGAEGERTNGTWREYIIEDSITGAYEVDTWRPSIHMPRWASRISLEITAVRVERLQQITEANAIAEGAFETHTDDMQRAARVAASEGQKRIGARDYFRQSWDSIYAHKQLGWEQNPWVWVIDFKRLPAHPSGERA